MLGTTRALMGAALVALFWAGCADTAGDPAPSVASPSESQTTTATIQLEAATATIVRDTLRAELSVSSMRLAADNAPSWSWSLYSVHGAGGEGVAIDALSRPYVLNERTIALERGIVREVYVDRTDRVEQRFILDEAPRISGDLVIEGRVDSDAGYFAADEDGWLWFEDDLAIRMGGVTVFDAEGEILPAHMDVDEDETRIVIDGDALARASYPVTVDPEIGTDERISNAGTNGDVDFDAQDAAVAYNATDNEYLIVFESDALNNDEVEIHGQRYSAEGSEVGANDFRISTQGPDGDGGFDALEPAVAWNSTDNQYLVVWYGDATAARMNIYGQILSATGALVGSAVQISNAGTAGDGVFDARDPAIVYNATRNEFLVAWEADTTLNGEDEIYTRVVAADGTFPGAENRVSTMGPDDDSSFDAADPALAWNSTQNTYLVVWRGDDSTDGEDRIYGQHLSVAGADIGNDDFVVLDPGTVGDGMFDATEPTVAFSTTRGEYGVASTYDVGANVNEIAFRAVGGAGPALRSAVVVSGVTGWAGVNAFSPSIAWEVDDDAWYVAYDADAEGDGLNEIFLASVSSDDTVAFTDTQISVTGPAGDDAFDAFDPSVAYNSVFDEILVAWAGDVGATAGETEVIVQLWGDALPVDMDMDGFRSSIDCDDNDPNINPGASEVLCNMVDENCNGLADDDTNVDGDPVSFCDGDCDDDDGTIFPGADETLCDMVDQNCNGDADDDVNADGDAVSLCDGDCDDDDDTVFPGADETLCDMVDQNCNGDADDDVNRDGDAVSFCDGDCNDDDDTIYPGAPELCDGVDNDCADGVPADEVDDDMDGQAECEGDCDDSDDTIYPGAPELCDGLDNDCVDGVPADEADDDMDGAPLCADACPDDPDKAEAGVCGCGVADTGDADMDGTLDCVDACPADPFDDSDGDGSCDSDDNCPTVENMDQVDTDMDGLGDACDLCADGDDDTDMDGTCDLSDNCVDVDNADQADADFDGAGDLCDVCPNDPDDDVDLDACADFDNCPNDENSDQLDLDDDGLGDACDLDVDGDGIDDVDDNCPLVANADQADADMNDTGDACEGDADGDGVADDVDVCPMVPDADQTDTDMDGDGDACDDDDDDDGVDDVIDVCPLVADVEQTDTDADGLGDACDDDDDDDTVVDDMDNCPLVANDDQANDDGDTIGNACDVCPDDDDEDQVDTDADGVGDVCDACPDEAAMTEDGCPTMMGDADAGGDTGDTGADTGDTGTDAGDAGDTGLDTDAGTPDADADDSGVDAGDTGEQDGSGVGPDGGDDDGGGSSSADCSCSSAPTHPAAGWLLIATALLADRRRRK